MLDQIIRATRIISWILLVVFMVLATFVNLEFIVQAGAMALIILLSSWYLHYAED